MGGFPMDNISHDATSRTAGVRILTAAALVLLLGACSSTSADNTTATPAAASSPGSAPDFSAAPVGTSVAVIEKEFSITLAQATFTPSNLHPKQPSPQGTTPSRSGTRARSRTT
ncbi:MAG: hypothetical protein ACYCV4_10785 [Dermatophilaceae bacterium]